MKRTCSRHPRWLNQWQANFKCSLTSSTPSTVFQAYQKDRLGNPCIHGQNVRCMFCYVQQDITEMEHLLEALGLPNDIIALKQDRGSAYFLHECRDCVTRPTDLLDRVYFVIEAFCNLCDAKTGVVLLFPATMDAVGILRKNIEADCVSDPEGVALLSFPWARLKGVSPPTTVHIALTTLGYGPPSGIPPLLA
ncbi:unnamed protein product [Discosporangium mesarthrocarpum]